MGEALLAAAGVLVCGGIFGVVGYRVTRAWGEYQEAKADIGGVMRP